MTPPVLQESSRLVGQTAQLALHVDLMTAGEHSGFPTPLDPWLGDAVGKRLERTWIYVPGASTYVNMDFKVDRDRNLSLLRVGFEALSPVLLDRRVHTYSLNEVN